MSKLTNYQTRLLNELKAGAVEGEKSSYYTDDPYVFETWGFRTVQASQKKAHTDRMSLVRDFRSMVKKGVAEIVSDTIEITHSSEGYRREMHKISIRAIQD